MHLRKSVLLIIFGIFLLIFFAQAGCSSKEEPPKASIHEKLQRIIREETKKKDESSKVEGTVRNDRSRRDLLAVAEACDKQYASCTEKCENGTCEDRCMKSLKLCEKNLPEDLQTIK